MLKKLAHVHLDLVNLCELDSGIMFAFSFCKFSLSLKKGKEGKFCCC